MKEGSLEKITSAMQLSGPQGGNVLTTAVLHSESEPVILTYYSGWRSSEGRQDLGRLSTSQGFLDFIWTLEIT